VHGRATPTHDNDGVMPLSPDEISEGITQIREFIQDFDYVNILRECTPAALLARYRDTADAYSRILLLRMYCEQLPEVRQRLANSNDVLLKYIDESFHIENDYVYMLDVRRFDIVPNHIIVQADSFVATENPAI